MDEIAAASQEQFLGVEQVNNAMGQMESIILQNASNAEESAAVRRGVKRPIRKFERDCPGIITTG